MEVVEPGVNPPHQLNVHPVENERCARTVMGNGILQLIFLSLRYAASLPYGSAVSVAYQKTTTHNNRNIPATQIDRCPYVSRARPISRCAPYRDN